jgi:tyrosine-protein kinase
MEIRQYLSLAWKWLWLIVLSTGMAAGISYYTTSQQPKLYQASAKLLVGRSIQNPDPNTGDLFTSQQLALTYIQIVKTRPVLQGTIDALGLQMSPDQLDNFTNASIIQGTQLMQLSVIDTNPSRAQALANELAHQLTLQGPAAAQQAQAKRREFAQNQVDELQKKIQDAQNQTVELNSSIQATTSAREIADQQQQILALQAQITQWQQTYATLLATLAPTSPNYLEILETASLPTFPIAPNVTQSVLLAAIVGSLLAVAGAFLVEFLDDSVKSPDELSQLLQLPTLGSIAPIPSVNEQKLIVALAPHSPITEAYRILRTNIQFSSLDKPIKSILVTSPGPVDGKSVTAANLAVVMAQAGLRTILVDSDLRKPTQHRIFGLTNDVGLTNGLMTQSKLDGFARPTKVENLRVITTGPLPPNPAEVLGSERMRALKAQLEAEADILIFDSPPSLLLTDAAVIARLVDGVILVLDMPRVRREAAARAKETLEKVGGHILGLVLNRVHPRGSEYYYYYYYLHARKDTHSRKQHAEGHPLLLRQWIKALTRH